MPRNPMIRRGVLLAALLAAQTTSAFAQDYPNRPITLIVPYAAGGGNDLMARTAAEKMSKTLGQQIVIENRGGAGGSIATRQIAAGTGSGIHLGTEYFATMAGIKLTHIPYKGSGPALTDLVGGHVAVYFSSLPPALALVKEGKVRALAVTGAKRSQIFPDLPTVAEAALPGYEAVLHYGIVAPAGTSRPIIDKLSAALRAAVMSEDLKARLANDGAEPLASTPEEYAADIDREESKWSAIVKASGAKAE
jgi:tripartite-type tricarboxylate transporter receptor subunit TctC